MIYLNYANLLETKLDFGISILAIAISITLLLFENIAMIDIAHFLYLGLIFYVSFLSKNQYLLSLNVVMLVLIIFTRYYFDGCLLLKKQKHSGFFYDLSEKYLFLCNADYLFSLQLVVSLGRLLKLKEYL